MNRHPAPRPYIRPRPNRGIPAPNRSEPELTGIMRSRLAIDVSGGNLSESRGSHSPATNRTIRPLTAVTRVQIPYALFRPHVHAGNAVTMRSGVSGVPGNVRGVGAPVGAPD
jgi:hypothetical protein